MSEFDNILNFDSIGTAESITGQSYKDDEHTDHLAGALFVKHNEMKRDELFLRNDTYYAMPFVDALAIYLDLGFEEIFEREYERGDGPDVQKVFWRDGVLAVLTSYRTAAMNHGVLYYNWEPNPELTAKEPDGTKADRAIHWSDYTSTGTLHHDSYDKGRYVWIGETDAKEALRHKLGQLEGNGTFLPVWLQKPFLWFPTFEEEKREGYDYKFINEAVEAQFPQYVIDAMNGVTA